MRTNVTERILVAVTFLTCLSGIEPVRQLPVERIFRDDRNDCAHHENQRNHVRP